MAQGATYNYTFTKPGTYNYLCVYHVWMTGTVTVLAGSPAPSGGTSSGVAVSIPNGAGDGPQAAPGYTPDKITVVIGVNNTVTWTNNDPIHHTVTSVSGNGSLNSGDMAQGATYSYTFTKPGTYNYYCVYHVWMTGTVVVEAAAG
ncbi:MAG: cupredoxin domain-containing protein [Nitrososphaerota archaeon]|nr:cupredoxin domain-containing protein [Nitrososphaerota archaeon]